MVEIYLAPRFKKTYISLQGKIKIKAAEKEKIFKQNTFHSSLDTHRLHGKWQNYWSFSVNKSYRIMFQFLDATKTKVVFINIGTHEIYK